MRKRVGLSLRVASFMGMDRDARRSLERLSAAAVGQRVGVAGRFMPDAGVSRYLAERGIVEQVEAADGFKYGQVFAPYHGVGSRERQEWQEAGVDLLEDALSPRVQEAQKALENMGRRGQLGLVIGCHDESESVALCGAGLSTRIIENTTDTARLRYAPAFGVVCHTQISQRRVKWLLEQLRLRYRDARITYANTLSAGMIMRLQAMEKLVPGADHVVIVGEPGEVSCESLKEEAWRHGKSATIVRGPEDCRSAEIAARQVVLTAGAYATDAIVCAVARTLVGKE